MSGTTYIFTLAMLVVALHLCWSESCLFFFCAGRYYMSMGCQKIVAEPLTITGSIGVVTGKFNLKELFERVG